MAETLGFCEEMRPESCGLILFGATGDLAARKILPALFGLCEKNLIPKNFYILLSGRTPLARRAGKQATGGGHESRLHSGA